MNIGWRISHAGDCRSVSFRPLLAPAGLETRPTADRLRETLFNVLTNGAIDRIAGATFLDLYAGSGAVGIEALSRGAARVTFVEQGAPALAVLQKNFGSLGIRAGFELEKRSVASFLKRALAKAESHRFDVVFLDPPYEPVEEYASTLGLLGGDCVGLLSDGAMVIAEHRRKHVLAENYGRLSRTRQLDQGDASLSFYSLHPAEIQAES